jgi:hypothetical protein
LKQKSFSFFFASFLFQPKTNVAPHFVFTEIFNKQWISVVSMTPWYRLGSVIDTMISRCHWHYGAAYTYILESGDKFPQCQWHRWNFSHAWQTHFRCDNGTAEIISAVSITLLKIFHLIAIGISVVSMTMTPLKFIWPCWNLEQTLRVKEF